MQDVCRTCMKDGEELMNLFEQDALLNTLMECISVTITEDDQLPKQICSPCSNTLKLISNFRKLVTDTQKKFHTRLGIMQEPNVTVKTEPKDYRQWECDKCRNRFFNKYLLDEHKKKVHLGNLQFSCAMCPDKFKQMEQLKAHIHTHHKDYRPHECEYCVKRFQTRTELTKHQRVHSGERPYACSVCGKRFKESCKLRRHSAVHNKERPHACDQCSKSYRQRCTLVVHMRTHNGEKPYTCETCGKCFAIKSQLDIHKRVHSDDKPYECDECHKRFNQIGNFRSHQLRHATDKPFKCNECDKQFNLKGSLKKHMRIHTGEQPYACDKCGKRFFDSSPLYRHNRKGNCLIKQEIKQTRKKITNRKKSNQITDETVQPITQVTTPPYTDELKVENMEIISIGDGIERNMNVSVTREYVVADMINREYLPSRDPVELTSVNQRDYGAFAQRKMPMPPQQQQFPQTFTFDRRYPNYTDYGLGHGLYKQF